MRLSEVDLKQWFKAGSGRMVAWCAGLMGTVLILTLIAGCQSDPPSSAPYAGAPTLVSDPGMADYATNLLHEGDVISITFQYATNFNAVQKITLDGLVNLDSAGAVKAAGKTPLELQTELAKIYKLQGQGDSVTVKLVSAVARIYVSGAVFHPGPVIMERPLTVLEAVMEAGGFDPTRAKLSGASVLRIEDGKQKAYHINLQKVLDGDDETPFYLRPFDIVHVPSKTFNF